MSFTLGTAQEVLVEFALPVARTQFDNSTPALSLIETSNDNVVGKEVVVSLHTGRNSSITNVLEGDLLSRPGRQRYNKIRIGMHTITGRGQVSQHAMDAIDGSVGLDGPPGMSEMERITDDFSRDTSRQIWGTSNGVIATCGTTNTSNVIQLAAATTTVQLRQFFVGMRVDIGTVDGPTDVDGNREITSIDVTNKTITLSGAAISTTSSHSVFKKGNGGSGVNQREFTSIPTIVGNSNTLYGLSPTTQPLWASVYNTAVSNRAPTEAVFEAGIDDVTINGGTLDVIFATFGVARTFAGTLTSNRRHVNTLEVKGGFGIGLAVASGNKDIPLVRDKDVPAETAWGISLAHLRRAQWSDGLKFMDMDGSIWKPVPDMLEYQFTMYGTFEWYTDRRNVHCKWDKLNES